MNNIFFSGLSGLNIVIGCAMFLLLFTDITKNWSTLARIGFYTMSLGLLGQAIYVIAGTSLEAPIWEQLWIFKDLGVAIFTFDLIIQFISRHTK